MILKYQFHKSTPHVILLHQELLQHRGGEPRRGRTARPGVPQPPKKGTTAPPAARGPALGVLCPEPPSGLDGLCYPTAAAAAPTWRWDGARGWGDGTPRAGVSLEGGALPRLLARDRGHIALPGVLFLALPSCQSSRFPWQRSELKGRGKRGKKKRKAELRSKAVEKAGPRSCHTTLSAITHPGKFSNTQAAQDSRKANFSLAAGKKKKFNYKVTYFSTPPLVFT